MFIFSNLQKIRVLIAVPRVFSHFPGTLERQFQNLTDIKKDSVYKVKRNTEAQ